MEPAAAGALYGIETLVEGALAFAKGIYNPTMPLNATFTRIPAPFLPRSSHTLSVVRGRAYIFGGEVEARKPVDNSMHMIILPSSGVSDADYQEIPARPANPGGEIPAARVGHTAATIDERIYVFGGRGGADMKALDEGGRVWVFSTTTSAWSYFDPPPSSPKPEPRSYHASCAIDLPRPPPPSAKPRPLIDNLPQQPPDPERYLTEPIDPDSYGTVFIHAGCTSSGGRTSDLWGFDVSTRIWSQYPDAPGPTRGGASLALAGETIYRFGGFDGTQELGGQLDFLKIGQATFNDKGGAGEMALTPLSSWQSNMIPPVDSAPGSEQSTEYTGSKKASTGISTSGKALRGPGNRSVGGLLPITSGQGRNYLIVFNGERDPSSDGHAAAGKFWDDAWSFQLKPEGMTAASLKDATRIAINKKTGEGQWDEVKYFIDRGGVDDAGVLGETGGGKRMIHEGQERPMGGRGWFAADKVKEVDGATFVVWGGLNGKNEMLGDGWMVTIE